MSFVQKILFLLPAAGRRPLAALLLPTLLVMAGCRNEGYTPRPRGYYRVELPPKAYTTFSAPGYPYRFEYPVYGRVGKDSAGFTDAPKNPYWLNIDFPELAARIYLTYNRISAGEPLSKLLEDAHFMSFYHTKRADYLDDAQFRNAHGVTGLTYQWGGDAASSVQFIATDSVQHFIRGALYFDVTPNADSLKPVIKFLHQDVQHLLETMRWE